MSQEHAAKRHDLAAKEDEVNGLVEKIRPLVSDLRFTIHNLTELIEAHQRDLRDGKPNGGA